MVGAKNIRSCFNSIKSKNLFKFDMATLATSRIKFVFDVRIKIASGQRKSTISWAVCFDSEISVFLHSKELG